VAKTLHVTSNNAGVALATNSVIGIGGHIYSSTTEANLQRTFRGSGTFSKLAFRTDATGTGRVLRWRTNGANGSQAASATDSTAGVWEDGSNTDTPSAGDEVNYQLTETGSNPTLYWARSVFTAASGHVSYFQSNEGNAQDPSTPRFYFLNGRAVAISNELNVGMAFRSACTLRNLFVRLSANGNSGNTTFTTRINGSDGNLSVTFSTGATGILEDTANSDSVAVDDEVNYGVSSTGSGNVTPNPMGVMADWSAAQDDGFAMCGTAGAGLARTASATVHYLTCIGANSSAGVTNESQTQVTPSFNVTLSDLTIYVGTNNYTADATLTLRNNGADGNQIVTIGAGATGFFTDNVNTDNVLAANPFNCSIVGGSANSMTFWSLSVTMINTAAASAIPSIMHQYRRRRI
jgi:hypothetical protein